VDLPPVIGRQVMGVEQVQETAVLVVVPAVVDTPVVAQPRVAVVMAYHNAHRT